MSQKQTEWCRVPVYPRTRERLKKAKMRRGYGATYDGVINELLDETDE